MPASVIAGGLPVLLRRGFDDPVADLALRAFLNQPLIVYGHHGDVRDGLGRLAELAALINRLGHVRWESISEIAASNFETAREGDALRVRLFTRRARVQLPPGVTRVVAELPALDRPPAAPDRIEQARSGTTVELLVRRRAALDGEALPTPPVPAWAIARRVLSESRDRITARLQDHVSAIR
jgi:hypothetical protein